MPGTDQKEYPMIDAAAPTEAARKTERRRKEPK